MAQGGGTCCRAVLGLESRGRVDWRLTGLAVVEAG